MSEHISEPGESSEEYDWAANFQMAHEHLRKIDLTAVNRSYGFGDNRRAEIIPVAKPYGAVAHVIRERFSSPESEDRRHDNYYFLGKIATNHDGECLLVLKDHSLEHEMDMIRDNDFGRVKERQYGLAAQLSEGLSDELRYPEVTLGTPHDMHRFILALNGIAAVQRAELASQREPEA